MIHIFFQNCFIYTKFYFDCGLWVNISTDWSIIFNHLKLYLFHWCKMCQAVERCGHTSKLPILTSTTLLRKIETWLDTSSLVVPKISFKLVWKQSGKKFTHFPIQIERTLSTGLQNILIAISTIQVSFLPVFFSITKCKYIVFFSGCTYFFDATSSLHILQIPQNLLLNMSKSPPYKNLVFEFQIQPCFQISLI